MRFISRGQILSVFKTYNEIKFYIFEEHTGESCARFGIKENTDKDSFRQNKERKCSCLRFSEFRDILRFYYNYDLSNVADGREVLFQCCPDVIVDYTKLQETNYLIKPVVENWEYEQIETYLNTDKTEDKGNCFYQCVYIYVACIMSYKHKYTSLMFFSDFMEKEKEKIENYQEKIDAFIFDFVEAVGIYCKFLLNRKMLSFSNVNLEEIAKEFLSNVARCSRKNTNIARYSEDFVM